MHDARSGYLGRMSIPAQQTVEQRATPVAGCRVHYQACRFVDHEQMGVFVRHVERHDLGSKSLAFLRGTHLQLNAVAHLYALCGFEHRLPIQTRGTCSQKLLQIGTRKFRYAQNQGTVEALSVLIGVDHQGSKFALGLRRVSILGLHLAHR